MCARASRSPARRRAGRSSAARSRRTSSPSSSGRRSPRRGSSRPQRRRFEAAHARAPRRALHALRALTRSPRPVSATNASSRFAGRRTPSGASPSSVSARMIATAGPLRRLGQPFSRASSLDLREPRGRPVDLEHLLPACARDELGRRALSDDPALPTSPPRCRRGARPPRCSACSSAPSRRLRAGRRSATTAPGASAGRGRPSARRAAPGAAGGSGRARRAAGGACRRRARARSCRRAARGSRCSSARSTAAARSRARDAIEAREHRQDLPAGELDVEVVELRHDAHLHARLLGFARQLVAEHRDRARVGERLRGQHAHRRRLARAVRAEQAEADALGTSRSRPSTARSRRSA